MTLQQRADAFNAAYTKWPASHLHVFTESGKPVIYGRWLIGQDYQNKLFLDSVDIRIDGDMRVFQLCGACRRKLIAGFKFAPTPEATR